VTEDADRQFQRFVERHEPAALARVFDLLAPELVRDDLEDPTQVDVPLAR